MTSDGKHRCYFSDTKEIVQLKQLPKISEYRQYTLFKGYEANDEGLISFANDFNLWNNHLDIYNLYSFQHRILFRLHTYIYKILHFNNSPRNLSNQFIFNSALNKKYSLRNLNDLYVPSISIFNDNGNKQFNYFFSRFINEIMNANEIETDFDIFKSKIKTNINSLFLDFMVSFPNFDLKFKTMNNNYKKF
jgi:hypothetical protein